MVAATASPERLLSRQEAADFLGVKPQTLAAWKSTGRYPLRVFKVGRLARYRQSDLEKFIASRAVGGEECGE